MQNPDYLYFIEDYCNSKEIKNLNFTNEEKSIIVSKILFDEEDVDKNTFFKIMRRNYSAHIMSEVEKVLEYVPDYKKGNELEESFNMLYNQCKKTSLKYVVTRFYNNFCSALYYLDNDYAKESQIINQLIAKTNDNEVISIFSASFGANLIIKKMIDNQDFLKKTKNIFFLNPYYPLYLDFKYKKKFKSKFEEVIKIKKILKEEYKNLYTVNCMEDDFLVPVTYLNSLKFFENAKNQVREFFLNNGFEISQFNNSVLEHSFQFVTASSLYKSAPYSVLCSMINLFLVSILQNSLRLLYLN